MDDADKVTPDLRLDRQIRIGTRIQYDWNENVTVGVVFEYLDAKEADIDQEGNPLLRSFKGEYDPNVIRLFVIKLIWKF